MVVGEVFFFLIDTFMSDPQMRTLHLTILLKSIYHFISPLTNAAVAIEFPFFERKKCLK